MSRTIKAVADIEISHFYILKLLERDNNVTYSFSPIKIIFQNNDVDLDD